MQGADTGALVLHLIDFDGCCNCGRSFGWSHGKEIMNGKPDTLKGSYYANPTVDSPTIAEAERKAYPEYYGNNICAYPLVNFIPTRPLLGVCFRAQEG